jgi:hypothetical protein
MDSILRLTGLEMTLFTNDIKSSDDSTAALKVALKSSIFPQVLLKMNTGPGKVFPGGPVCTFKGCSILTIVCRSPPVV